MAGVKITDLASLEGTPDDNDVIVIVDVSQDFTKKISVADLVSATPIPDLVNSSQNIVVNGTNGVGEYYLTMTSLSSGTDSAKADTNLKYNASNGVLTAPGFEGNGGLLTNVLADSAARSAYALFAQNAQDAVNALSADSAVNATNSINAINANSSLFATTSLYADSASRATTALSADFALFALGTDSAENSSNSINALRADSASLASLALFANAADTSVTSQFSDSAARATNALFALNAQDAVNSRFSDSALYANNAGFALTAINADSAVNASNAVLAQYALESLSALKNIRDSASGVRILGETTIDSDLFVKGSVFIDGIFYGDGSGLTNVSSTSVAETAKQIDASILDSSGLCYVMIRQTETGYDSVNVTNNLIYDPLTEIFSAPYFSGDGSLLTNVSATEANFAAAVEVSTVNDNSTYFVHLGSTNSGNDNVNVDINLRYNPALNKLSTGRFETGDWEVFEEGTSLFFSYNGVKKARLDTNGNLALVGTLTQNATL